MWNTSADNEWEVELGSLNYIYLNSDIHIVFNVQKRKHVGTTKCTVT